MNERFQFLKTYADSLIELEKADKDLARELARKIIQYGIYNNDYDSGNPIIEAMFVQIKVMLDRGQDITEKRRNANKQRTNINKIEQNLTNEEQKLTNEEQEALKVKSKNIKSKNNNLKIKEDKSSYGNEEVNLCLELIQKYNGGASNGSTITNRRYAYLLINKLKKLDSVEKGSYKRYEVLESILTIINGDKYYSTKISSPQLIFDNLGTLVKRCAVLGKEQEKKQQMQEATLNLI